ncbi:MAG: YdcF family protein [bacterium]|nr:YdcF family protein [bacterium]
MKKAKEKLIPFDKSKRVIYLEERGKAKKYVPIVPILFGVLGIACIAYCVAIGLNGFGTRFFLVWGALGAVFFLIGLVLSRRRFVDSLPKWFKVVVTAGFWAGVLLFIVVEGLILSRFGGTARPGADYMVVLGAQWKTGGPSDVLRRRLDRAVEYLRENPATVVVVSGGQGRDEIMPEAEGMRQYLIDAGIEEDRILTEGSSTNTRENLVFSAGLIDSRNGRTVIVTNNFHVFRAVKIAEKQGYQAEGLAADSVVWMVPNNLLREFFGVVKDFLVGNL